MTLRDGTTGYTRTAVFLHWLVAAVVFGQFAFGWLMQEIPKSPPGMRADAFNLHKSVGLCLLGVMLFRLGWRIGHRPPPLPAMPRWQARAAKVNHAALYAALIVMPLAGYLGSVWSGYPVKWFGVALPAWGGSVPWLKSLMSDVHLATSLVLATLVAIHVGAALWHAARGDGVFARMMRSSTTARRPRAAPRVSRAA